MSPRIKKTVTIFAMAAMIVLCTGCGRSNEAPDAFQGEKTASKIKIGFSMSTLREERWQRDRDVFVARAKELGADVIVQNANNDSDEQQRQVRYLLNQDIDILVIVPQDASRAADEVQQAKKQGIRVISYDRLVLNADVDLYISFDNVRVGELMAESLTQQVPMGNYVIINGANTDNNCFMFNKGYMNVLKSYVERGDIKIISEVWAKDWMHEDAFNCIVTTLRSGQTIDAVIAANDSLAAAAIEALSEKRLAGKVPVVGHDADLSGCQRVAEGTQLMTVYKPIHQIAKRAAEISIQMAMGEKVEANSTLFDGKYNVPYYMIQPVAVTRDNLRETVIKDSFHRLEDIYMNVPKSQWPSE